MKRWTEKQNGAAALAAIALAVGILSGKTVPGRVEDDSQVAQVPGHVAALGTVKTSDAATSAPAGPTGIDAPRAASPAPAVEYVARWSHASPSCRRSIAMASWCNRTFGGASRICKSPQRQAGSRSTRSRLNPSGHRCGPLTSTSPAHCKSGWRRRWRRTKPAESGLGRR